MAMTLNLDDLSEKNLRIMVNRYHQAKGDPSTSKAKLQRNTKELADLSLSIFKELIDGQKI